MGYNSLKFFTSGPTNWIS